MDDMYQYAASAVNSNNPSSSQPKEEDDVILKAFNSISWGKKWSSLVDTVKKQSEAFVEGTKKDLQEMAQIITEDGEDEEENTRGVEEPNPLETIRESLGKINTVNFSSLRDGLTQTLNQNLPQQLKSVRLPENMDLGQLKEGLLTGTRSAEHYLQQFGNEVITTLKNTVTVLEPEQPAQEESSQTNSKPVIYATRKEGLIAKMQSNEDTFLKDHHDDSTNDKVLGTFNSSFNIEEYTEEIAQLLNDHPHLRDMMDRLVPIQVSYSLFWQRYFYHVFKIEQDEQKRQLIVDSSEHDEDFKWDSEDEDTHTIKNEVKSEDTDDFSNISGPTSSNTSPPLKSSPVEDEWVKAEKKKSDDEDSDSDWE